MAKVRSDTGPFSMVPHWLLKQQPSGNALLVYAHLAVFADWNSGSGACWPSRTTLALRTGLSAATVDRALAELRNVGAISRESGKAKGSTSTHYVHRVPPEGASWVSDPWITDGAGGASRVTHRTRTTERNRYKSSPVSTPASSAGKDSEQVAEGPTLDEIRADRERQRAVLREGT